MKQFTIFPIGRLHALLTILAFSHPALPQTQYCVIVFSFACISVEVELQMRSLKVQTNSVQICKQTWLCMLVVCNFSQDCFLTRVFLTKEIGISTYLFLWSLYWQEKKGGLGDCWKEGGILSELSIAYNYFEQCTHIQHAISMQLLTCKMLHRVGVYTDTFCFGSRYCGYCEGRKCPCLLQSYQLSFTASIHCILEKSTHTLLE